MPGAPSPARPRLARHQRRQSLLTADVFNLEDSFVGGLEVEIGPARLRPQGVNVKCCGQLERLLPFR